MRRKLLRGLMGAGVLVGMLSGCQSATVPAANLNMKPVRVMAPGMLSLNGDARADAVSVEAPLSVQAQRTLQAVVNPWTSADIDHVKLNLFIGAAGTATHTFTVPQASLASTIKINNLSRSTAYRIEALAYQDAGETVQIDNFATSAASCTTNFTTTTDDVLTIAPPGIVLKLRDKTFSGLGSGAITVTAGSVVDTATAPTLSF